MHKDSNVIVVSHRRSGTHLLTDILVNVFKYGYIERNYLDFKSFYTEPHPTEHVIYDDMEAFKEQLAKGKQVTFTHTHDFNDYLKYNLRESDNEAISNIYKNSKIIFLMRDGCDIMSSLYNRPKNREKYKDFNDFYKNYDFDDCELNGREFENISECLLDYYRNWIAVVRARRLLDIDIEVVSFEDIITKYSSVIKRLEIFLDHHLSEDDIIYDLRRRPNQGLDSSIKYTTRDFHKGTIGDYQNYIPEDISNHFIHLQGRNLENLEEYFKGYNRDLEVVFGDKKDESRAAPHRAAGAKKFSKCPLDIEKRYTECSERHGDPRYGHKVFFYDKEHVVLKFIDPYRNKDRFVLKFVDPYKHYMSNEQYNEVCLPLANKMLDKIEKCYDTLYDLKIIPKLHYAGIHNGSICLVQDFVPCLVAGYFDEYYDQFNKGYLHILPGNPFPALLDHFVKAYDRNILLVDIVNPYNIAWQQRYEVRTDKEFLDYEVVPNPYADNVHGRLTYLDTDGIEIYDSKEQLRSSPEFQEVMDKLKTVNEHYLEAHGIDMLAKTPLI